MVIDPDLVAPGSDWEYLQDDEEGQIIVFPGVEPSRLAANVSLLMGEEGFLPTADLSRRGRNLRRYQREGEVLMVATGALTDGAFCALVPAARDRWTTLGDEASPALLRVLLPPPPSEEGGNGSR